MRILAFSASNSSVSINRMLAEYAASLAEGHEIETLEIFDYEMPIYRKDREEADGIPQLAHDFLERIEAADALIISFPEHNGSYTAAFKNLFDWCSRIGREVWKGKRMLALSASPGPGAAARSLDTAASAAPYFGGEVIGTLSVPKFNENFDKDAGKLTNDELDAELRKLVERLIG